VIQKNTTPFKTERFKYTIYGICLGIIFPVIGTTVECSFRGMGFSLEQLINCQKLSPALWLVDLAPIVLGIIASMAGKNLDQVKFKSNQLNDRFQQMVELREIADKANKAKSEFLANMSHEIRTPMNAILGMSYLMKKTELNEKQLDYNRKVEISAKNLLRIIDDILDFSKIEAGKLSLETAPFDLEELIANVTDAVNVKLIKKINVELITEIDAAVPNIILGDSVRLRQVLLNLIDNAVKFTDKGEIKVRVKLVQKMSYGVIVQFTIQDSGIGMSEEALKKLFQPFEQADLSTTRKFGGTGLGLAISRKIVQMMDGELKASSKIDVGSEFVFNAYFSLQENEKISRAKDNVVISGQKVLLVDDSESARMILSEMLLSLGFEVIEADNAKDAIQLFHVHQETDDPFSLFVVDWQMPGMDGLQLVNHLKAESPESVPSVLMVTSYGLETLKQAQSDNVINKMLVKPISPSQLFESIDSLLSLGISKIKESPVASGNHLEFSKLLKGKKILLVEDNEINMELAVELLNDLGVEVFSAWNGLEAIEKLKLIHVDLVLMDIQMPEMDGLSATRHIRETLQLKDLPVLAMTAHAMKGEYEKSIAAGMNDHITKPIDPIELYRSIIRHLKLGLADKEFSQEKLTPTENAPFTIEGIDVAMGLKRAAGKIDVYLKMLHTFVKNFGNFSAKTQLLMSQNRFEETGVLLHTVAGVAGNIGMNEIYKKALKLSVDFKNHVQAGNQSFEHIHQQQVNEIARLLETNLDRLNVFLSSLENENSAKETISEIELEQLLTDLKNFISDNDPEAIRICKDLIDKYTLSSDLEEKLKRILEEIENFEFENALNLLK
jgi:two-component system sensor histidine kinase/response regulator